MKGQKILLFVMPGCQVCPQMERLFHQMHQKGAISELEIINVSELPGLAEQYHIRSVPSYIINGVVFYGLKSIQEIELLLQNENEAQWMEMIQEELTQGELEPVERAIREQSPARQAMIQLLNDPETSLVVRIGLTAVIESLAETDLLKSYERKFIDMAAHEDPRIAVDALYYLFLTGTPACLSELMEISQNGPEPLKNQALELVEELAEQNVVH